jgi:hypothetical protein
MADYPISNVPRRVQYVNSGVGPYAFAFEVLVQTDIAVYRGSTKLTLTTDYTVTINSNCTGSVTLVAAGTGNITIVGARAIQRSSDYTTGGDLFASTLNTDLDSQTIFSQQLAEDVDLSIKVPVYAPSSTGLTVNPEANGILAWDSTGANLINLDPAALVNVAVYATAYADVFVSNGVAVAYTLSRNPGSLYNLDISVDGVTQEPVRDYTLLGTVVTFTSALPINSRIVIKYKEGLPNVSGDSQDIRYVPAGSSTVRTVQAKLRETVSVKDFGAVGDGVTDDTAAIQAAIDENNGCTIYFPNGTYAVGSTINIDSCACYFVFERAIIKPIANGFTIFKATVDAYGIKFIDLIVRGAGTTGVTVFDVFRMVRQGAGIIRCDIDSVETGIFLNGLCYGIDIDAPNIFNVDNPIIVKAAAGAVKINHPIIDMNGKAGVGIDIFEAILPIVGAIQNVGTQIIGGACEGGTIGIRDASVNTQVIGTYFERNTDADISLVNGSKMFGGTYTSHTSSVGTVAIKARNTDAAQIYHPFMSNAGRSTGLFDFDATNTNCYYDVLFGASSFNLPLGVVTGINNQTNKPGPIGGVTRNDGKFSTLSSTGVTEFAQSRTASNPLSIATATPTTFLTLPGSGQYEIFAFFPFSGGPTQYTATATVLCDGNGARIIANNGTNLFITLSGLNVQVEQTSGSTQTFQFVYSRMA